MLARDNGSSDATVSILNEYAERLPSRFRVMPSSPGTGSPKDNFLLLMRASSAQYICFSDQDDIWLPDKVSRTKKEMDELESRWGADTPLLVFTDAHVVDDQLITLHESFWAREKIDPERIHHLALLLGRSVVTGCTMLLNRRLDGWPTSDRSTTNGLPHLRGCLHHPCTCAHSPAPYGVFRSEAISVVCFLRVQV